MNWIEHTVCVWILVNMVMAAVLIIGAEAESVECERELRCDQAAPVERA